jgi:hypothetical protein
MSRKRLAALAALALAALVVAGVAAAARHRTQSSQAVTASFAAASISHANSKTCTAADGTYRETTATYSGTATSSDPRLNGQLTIRAHSVVDTTTGIGWTEGSFRVRGSGAGSHGTLHAAVSGTHAVGSVVGSVDHAQGKLVASVAAEFTQDAGFTTGALGSGSVTGAGIVFQRGSCTNAKHTRSVAVAHLRFSRRGVVPPSSGKGTATGTLTLDLTRDANGAITDAKAVFYVNYRFGAAVTITGLTLHQGAKGTNGPVVLDAGTGTIGDPDGNGNVTRVVGVSGSLAQALLANPRGYYVELASGTTLRAQLAGFGRR